ncbi:YdcF family protein [Mucilaginibacter ginsenosidivorax]|uniref:YdcF family protein n=1 Tax=Mucilaginibacter ginsenosidivorax TaxID=862126 RepID=A0A5B8W2B8_9SPHI|nr:YdcF family protein [Mucilaginibacter ginsenosidivorax]QEC77597.1 YdcF family protein [Mucilaginibacter ginsenosidivorax]
MKKFLLILFVSLCSPHVNAQNASQQYRLIGKNYTEIKNYYLLNLLQNYAPATKLIGSDAILARMAQAKLKNIQDSLKANKGFRSIIQPLKFSEQEIKTAGDRLFALYKPNNALGLLVKSHLIPSGCYIKYDSLAPAAMLVKAWEQDALAINHTIEVYAEGKKPNFPDVDSINFNVYRNTYPRLIADGATAIVKKCSSTKLFYLPSLNYALHSLDINGRNDAANDEPLEQKANKAAYNRLKTINWKKYRYTLILVPGEGPDKPGVSISKGSIERCKIAALKFAQGLTPFIMVSGGRVHPFKTRFAEAEEMKKYLVNQLKIPENGIFIEPQARHTTTNLRNCARLIFRYGMPFNKPFITSTNKIQSYYISYMDKRCVADLGYVPYSLGRRLSNTEQEFYPNIASLQINPLEPLDP